MPQDMSGCERKIVPHCVPTFSHLAQACEVKHEVCECSTVSPLE